MDGEAHTGQGAPGRPAGEPGARPGRSLAAERRLLAGLLAVVAVLVAAVHWRCLAAEALTFDDDQYLTRNYLVQSPSLASAGRFLREVLEPSTVRGYYQPLAMISLMLDSAMGGRPDYLRPYHRTSLAFHVANTVLVVVLLYSLFGRPWVAAGVGLLFGMHPLTVETIPWVGERKTLLAAFFSLWCLILYVRYARRKDPRLLWACVALYALALLSKPTSTPLPALLLLLDYWPLRRLSWRAVIEKWPFFIIGAASAVITVVSQKRMAGVETPGEHPPWRIPLFLCHNIIFYPWKMLWPVNLSSHYPVPSPLNLQAHMFRIGVIGTGVLLPLLLLSLRWTRAILTSWLIFFVAIFPTMGVLGFTNVIASDKYAYLPAVGFLIGLAWALGKAWDAASRAGVLPWAQAAMLVALVGAGAAEAAATRRQAALWRDSETLYQHMLRLAPSAPTLYLGYGDIQHNKGDYEKAIWCYRKSLALRPNFAGVENNLALVWLDLGNLDEAVRLFQEAIRHDPRAVESYNNLGTALERQGKTDEAIENYRAALRIKWEFPEAHGNLGLALARQGQIEKAAGHFAESVRLNPYDPEARNNLGRAKLQLGRLDEAARNFRDAIRLRPDHADAHVNLATCLSAQNRIDEAVSHLREAVRLRPDAPEYHNNLGQLLGSQGRLDEAIAHFALALRLRPDYAKARMNLAATLMNAGRTDEALAHYEQIERLRPDFPGLREALDAARAKKAAKPSP